MASINAKQTLKCKIKQGDDVIVVAGKDKGKQGTVKQVVRNKDRVKLLVEGVNMVKKHVKPNPNKGEQGGIKSIEALIDASNINIYNPVTKKADRIGYRLLEDGKKVRFYKSNGEVISGDA